MCLVFETKILILPPRHIALQPMMIRPHFCLQRIHTFLIDDDNDDDDRIAPMCVMCARLDDDDNFWSFFLLFFFFAAVKQNIFVAIQLNYDACQHVSLAVTFARLSSIWKKKFVLDFCVVPFRSLFNILSFFSLCFLFFKKYFECLYQTDAQMFATISFRFR